MFGFILLNAGLRLNRVENIKRQNWVGKISLDFVGVCCQNEVVIVYDFCPYWNLLTVRDF